MISERTIRRIREEVPIVEVIGARVTLKPSGRSHVGACPLCKRCSPSLHVNGERGFYHCFDCGQSGDAIRFLQETEEISFDAAATRLAERYRIRHGASENHSIRASQKARETHELPASLQVLRDQIAEARKRASR